MSEASTDWLSVLDGHGTGLASGVLADPPSLDLILAELQHRFRNIVSVTQSIVNQTLRDGVSVEHARETLNQRLAAMGTAVDLLAQGKRERGSLGDTIRAALAVHAGLDARIRCEGPNIAIGGHAALTLALALHELGTNAVKYGALSVPHGAVDLLWTLVPDSGDPRLSLSWVERGGPVVTMPTREGFGSKLISKATARALDGHAELRFAPSGVTWLFEAPLSRLNS